jgi:hypothetical protein
MDSGIDRIRGKETKMKYSYEGDFDGKTNKERYKKLLNEKFTISFKELEKNEKDIKTINNEKKELLAYLTGILKSIEKDTSERSKKAEKEGLQEFVYSNDWQVFNDFGTFIDRYYLFLPVLKQYHFFIDGYSSCSDMEIKQELNLFDWYCYKYTDIKYLNMLDKFVHNINKSIIQIQSDMLEKRDKALINKTLNGNNEPDNALK